MRSNKQSQVAWTDLSFYAVRKAGHSRRNAVRPLLASLKRQGQFQMVFFQQFFVGKYFQNRSVGDNSAFPDHDAAVTDIHNQIKIV
jgi:hypothetical protein